MLFNLPPTVSSTEAVIDIINTTQEQVIKKGMIDPESQVSCKRIITNISLKNCYFVLCTEIFNQLL